MNPQSAIDRAAWTEEVDLVFLVGCPRSGTTWLQAMLASHPEVYTGPETQFFATYQPVATQFFHAKDRRLGLTEYLTRQAFLDLVAHSFWHVVSTLPQPTRPVRYFLEKSPHHAANVAFILQTFPRARFLHLVRDPRAVVSSLVRISKSWGQEWAPKTVIKAADMWQFFVQHGQAIAARVESSDQYLELRYEDLRSEPEGHLTRLFQWLGLSASPELIRDAVQAHSLEKTRSGLHRCVPTFNRDGQDRQDNWSGEGGSFHPVHPGPVPCLNSGTPFASIPLPGANSVIPRVNAAYPVDFVGTAACSVEEVDLIPAELLAVEQRVGRLMVALGYAPKGVPALNRDGQDRQDDRSGEDRSCYPVHPGPVPCLNSGTRIAASVLVVGEGDDPAALLETLSAMAQEWQDEWELVLVSRCGSACQAAAAHLEGDVQVLSNREPVDYEVALNQAALTARGRDLIIPLPSGPVRVSREAFLGG